MHEGLEVEREGTARTAVEIADNTEIVEAKPPVRHDEQVARMGIAVEQADDEELVEIGVDEHLRDARAVDRRIAYAQATTHLLHENGLGEETVDHVRDVDRRPSSKRFAQAADAARLLPEVRLLAQVGPDLVDEPERLEALDPWRQGRGDVADAAEGPHVALDLGADAGPADLDDDGASVQEPRPMDLGDRGRRHGLDFEHGEQLVDAPAQPVLDRAPRVGRRKRAHAVLEVPETGQIGVRQEIAAQAHRLAELDEGRTEALQGRSQP